MSADPVEAILADFRAWLQEAKDAPVVDEAPGLDVATVVQHFTALRQEVNLQTKSSRSQLEQNAQTIVLLQEALEALHRQETQLQEAGNNGQDELLRPLLKTLIDAHDALSLAQREVRRLLDNPPVPAAGVPPPALKIWVPYWARWLGLHELIEKQLAPLRAWHHTQTQIGGGDESGLRFHQTLDALLTGYQMSLQRIERALTHQGLTPIECVGQSFNPETMEVAEVVREEGRAGIVVLDEVRRGYRWRDRLFRYAQVRVARS